MFILDNFLNKFTMYKVVLFGLLFLVIIVFVYSIFGIIFQSPLSLFSSLLILVGVCYVTNLIFSKILKVPVNPESSFITALILFFILAPIAFSSEVWIFVLAAVLAIGSKYLIVKNKKHIFNPAAFALVIIGFLGIPQISWWIGNSDLFPFVLVVGLLVVRKVRKIRLFTSYFIFALISISIFASLNNRDLLSTLFEAITTYPILFLGTIMLVEPLTTPPKNKTQIIYGGIVGFLSGAQFHHFGTIFSSPELALVIGNVYSYFVSFRQRLSLTFIDKKEIASGTFEYRFKKPNNFSFTAGQYMEWTLGEFRPDFRGVRRYFTISSSPTEEGIRIGTKVYNNGSKFKDKLQSLKKGDQVYVGSLAGDFVLENKKNNKYIFIAGGIGITPFRSIIKDAIDKNKKLNAILIYSASSENEFVYKNIFDDAKKIGLRTLYVCSKPSTNWNGFTGHVNKELIEKEVTDYKNRIFYLSGPNKLVNSVKNMLLKIGVRPYKVKADYFSGY